MDDMIRRLYVSNFKCLENFDLPIAGKPSSLLIGKIGAGKSAVAESLQVLQRIARGTNRVRDLVGPERFTRGRSDIPMRFELEVSILGDVYNSYLSLAEVGQFVMALQAKLARHSGSQWCRGMDEGPRDVRPGPY